MSAIAGLIPKIEGFQPIPNAVMIPFMETQSAALAFGFGLNYEYGKRKIRSMSNETFNSLTSEQISEMSANHSTILLQRFIQAVPQVMPAQTEIFKQYVEIEILKVEQNVKLAKWLAENAVRLAAGTGQGTDITTTEPSPDRTRAPPPITPLSTIQKHMTIYVWTATVLETTIRRFFKTAWPSATIISYRHAGTITVSQNTGKGKVKHTILIAYNNAFPLPQTTEILGDIYARL